MAYASQLPVAAARKPLLVCFSHLRWEFVFQRPQHLLTRATAQYDVVFWEEPEYEEARCTPDLRCRTVASGLTIATPLLPWGLDESGVDAAQRPLLDAMLATRAAAVSVAWFYTPMALSFASHVRARTIVYDCMDELAMFAGASPRLLLLERRLLRLADLVFTGGRSLHQAKQHLSPHAHCFPSAVDAAHFTHARGGTLADPPDQAGIPHPRIGFFGVLDERLDRDLVAAVADRRPDWQIVMIGPTAKIDPEDLPRRANLHWLGPKPYAALPSYLAGWDAGLMPFAINDATRFISPTKTPEFLAAGVPVVSTPVRDVVVDWGTGGLVEIADDADTAVERLAAVMRRPRGPWRTRVDLKLADVSWDATWRAMRLLICSSVAEGVSVSPAIGGGPSPAQAASLQRT